MEAIYGFFTNVFQAFQQFGIRDVIDILIIAILIYKLIMVTRGTRAIQVFKGIGIVLICAILANAFKLSSVQWVLNTILQSGAILAIVIFQPEIRKTLERLGRGNLLSMNKDLDESQSSNEIIKEISSAVLKMARKKTGALIVVQRNTGLSDIADTGTVLNATISEELIENIFEPNTPLHDGAIIISGEKIVAAGCILPLIDNNALSKELGTRHRAAIGISEVSDSITFVVSEETGVISYAKAGKIIRYLDSKAMKDILSGIYTDRQDSGITSVFRRKKNGK